MCITCTFVDGSSTTGCYVSIKKYGDMNLEIGLKVIVSNINESAVSCIDNVSYGSYKVTVFDLDTNENTSKLPVFIIDQNFMMPEIGLSLYSVQQSHSHVHLFLKSCVWTDLHMQIVQLQ